jgi:hypothetical protein
MFIPEVTDIEMILASGNDSETLIASFAFPPISSGLGDINVPHTLFP